MSSRGTSKLLHGESQVELIRTSHGSATVTVATYSAEIKQWVQQLEELQAATEDRPRMLERHNGSRKRCTFLDYIWDLMGVSSLES